MLLRYLESRSSWAFSVARPHDSPERASRTAYAGGDLSRPRSASAHPLGVTLPSTEFFNRQGRFWDGAPPALSWLRIRAIPRLTPRSFRPFVLSLPPCAVGAIPGPSPDRSLGQAQPGT